MNELLEKLKYPIGNFKCPDTITDDEIQNGIDILENFPTRLEELVKHLNSDQLNTPYRPGGWTVRQVVHHVSDSHHHSYIRFKWALTEDRPVIKYYYEQKWAELNDAKNAPIKMSLEHIKVVHVKLVYLLRSLSENELNKTFIHPEHNEETSLKENILKYAWHSKHHYAHIENLLIRNSWI
jgi:hypothetical protein